jgi:hypothetical protein
MRFSLKEQMEQALLRNEDAEIKHGVPFKYSDFKKALAIHAKAKCGDDLINPYFKAGHRYTKRDAIVNRVLSAHQWLILAELSIEEGKHIPAWYYLGEFNAALDCAECIYEERKRTRSFSDRGKKGGDKKSENEYRENKNEFARLIKENEPEAGWKDINEIANALYEPLSEYIKKRNSIQCSDEYNLNKSMKRWAKTKEISAIISIRLNKDK